MSNQVELTKGNNVIACIKVLEKDVMIALVCARVENKDVINHLK